MTFDVVHRTSCYVILSLKLSFSNHFIFETIFFIYLNVNFENKKRVCEEKLSSICYMIIKYYVKLWRLSTTKCPFCEDFQSLVFSLCTSLTVVFAWFYGLFVILIRNALSPGRGIQS